MALSLINRMRGLKHTAPRVAIVSARLTQKQTDVAAALGLAAELHPKAGDRFAAVVTTPGDPRESEAETFAIATGTHVVRFAPAPLRLALFDAAGRPLGYRITGATVGFKPDRDIDPAEARDNLLRLAPPGELRMEADFDPSEPGIVWLDPFDRRIISAARALEIAADALRHRARTSRRSVGCGVTRWKRPAVAALLAGPNGPPLFEPSPEAAARRANACGGRVVVWASRGRDAAEEAATAAGAPLARLEDGFLRSVGLGAAFTPALSLVLDEAGIYYDPSVPSELENLLNHAAIPPALADRAARLRARLVAENVTKYNVGAARGRIVPEGRRGVLAPGQVEDDASILKGAGAVRTNRDLLAAARARNPDAFIVYKPHPDVVAGYRKGAVAEAELARLADAVVVDGAIADLYPQCEALETMTSLSGFEALLRGLRVVTHGQPFYSGWGLTEDLAPHPRRGRARTLDELVAATLILYPLYHDPVSGLPCGPETALDRIAEGRARAATPLGRALARARHAYALARHRLLGPLDRRPR
ncbi:hypothetical protein GCM10008171_01060 [Methylopila jiangsuensis]|uniref:Capsule polysaccharide biosynthesis protein n=1 Tax=Methylopila jiangsuensis TaxID=586230 RepID=A0A9W6JFM5_9HYPH|nr:hypothetical protein GCM10008171_01060 [Methylopila jiangsuensis]